MAITPSEALYKRQRSTSEALHKPEGRSTSEALYKPEGRSIMITGGAGFIGSHVVRRFVTRYPDTHIINVDALTYAGNLENLRDIEDAPNYTFIRADICDFQRMKAIMADYGVTGVIHLAAESHVDRSIRDPFTFARTNVLGTLTLLEAARQTWQAPSAAPSKRQRSPSEALHQASGRSISEALHQRQRSTSEALHKPEGRSTSEALSKAPGRSKNLFYHISTDEVYGSLPLPTTEDPSISEALNKPEGRSTSEALSKASGRSYFTEATAYSPHSPYSASKASSDHFVRAYHDTYGLPTIVTNCSNNYGPYQFPEKLIPLFINNIRLGKPLPVYGKGENVRDWLYVEDHARAIDLIFHEGKPGETYNIGGFNEWRNIDLIRVIIKTVDRLLGRPEGHSDHLITYVTDRPGHDLRYAIDSSKLHRELGWSPSLQFEEGIEKTVRWYLDHPEWSDRILSGDYRHYYESMYGSR